MRDAGRCLELEGGRIRGVAARLVAAAVSDRPRENAAPWWFGPAVRDDFIHLLQHLSFAGTAALFWWGLIRGRYGRLGYGTALVYIFATAVHSGGLGALLAVSRRPWYSLCVDRAVAGADPLEDQQLGGFIMWVPSGIVMMPFGLGMFAAWLGEAERRRRKGWSP